MKTLMKLYYVLPLLFLVGCNWGHETSEQEPINKKEDSANIMQNDMPLKGSFSKVVCELQ